jgi:hypothetical protein
MNDDSTKSAVLHQYDRCWDQAVKHVGTPRTMNDKLEYHPSDTRAAANAEKADPPFAEGPSTR